MRRDTHLYIDLENTLIDDWFSNNLIYQRENRDLIEAVQPHSIRIFSLAVLSQDELKEAKRRIYPAIEDELGIRIDATLLLPEVIGLKTSTEAWDEYFRNNDKMMMFMNAIVCLYPEEQAAHYVLYDDTVNTIRAEIMPNASSVPRMVDFINAITWRTTPRAPKMNEL